MSTLDKLHYALNLNKTKRQQIITKALKSNDYKSIKKELTSKLKNTNSSRVKADIDFVNSYKKIVKGGANNNTTTSTTTPNAMSNNSTYTKLNQLINNGDIERVKNILDTFNDSKKSRILNMNNGALLEEAFTPSYNYSQNISDSRKEHIKYNMIKLLLENGANPNIMFSTNTDHVFYEEFRIDPNTHIKKVCKTPLIMATISGNLQLVNLLLQNGAEPNFICRNPKDTYAQGLNPLMMAYLMNNTNMVRLLLENKADPKLEYRYYLKRTFSFAARIENEITIPELIKANYIKNPYIKNLFNRKNSKELELKQVNKSKQDTNDNQSQQEKKLLLVYAIQIGDIDFISDILANLNKHEKETLLNNAIPFDKFKFIYPLQIACELYDQNIAVQIVTLLLEKGADPNIIYVHKQNTCGKIIPVTPLMSAADIGYLDMVKLLLEKGAEPNLQNIYNEKYKSPTALIIACSNGYKEIVELLLQNKANVDSTHKYDAVLRTSHKTSSLQKKKQFITTALIEASSKGYTEIVELLLANRANPAIIGAIYYFHYKYYEGNALEITQQVYKTLNNSNVETKKFSDIIELLTNAMRSTTPNATQSTSNIFKKVNNRRNALFALKNGIGKNNL